MKKAIIEFEFKKEIQNILNLNLFLEKIESYELIEILKIDLEQGIKILLMNITLKDGFNIHDLEIPTGYTQILSVIKSEGNSHIVLLKGQLPMEKFKELVPDAKKFDLNIIWTTPTVFNKEKMIISAIGIESELKKFLESWKELAVIKKLSFQPADFELHNVLSCLTDKQKDILVKAKKWGYYDYPRKIDSEKLSRRVGISKSTTIEHLRKAENRLITNILAGY